MFATWGARIARDRMEQWGNYFGAGAPEDLIQGRISCNNLLIQRRSAYTSLCILRHCCLEGWWDAGCVEAHDWHLKDPGLNPTRIFTPPCRVLGKSLREGLSVLALRQLARLSRQTTTLAQ